MQGTTLRELARAFAKGELGRDEYRRNRTKFVAAVLAGEVAVKNIDFPPPIRPPGGDGTDATEPRARRRRVDSTQEPESTTQITPPARPRPAAPVAARKEPAGIGRLVTGVLVAGIVAAAAWYIATRPSAEPAATAGAAGTPPATAAATPPPAATAPDDPRGEAGRALITQFLQDRNWSAARMTSFQADWSALDVEQRAAALNSADAGRLASAIYQRLLEERALSGLGDAEGSLAKQRELVGLATAVGITDARLSVPEPTPTSEAAAASPDTSTTE